MINDLIINPEIRDLMIPKKMIYNKEIKKNWEISILKEDEKGYLLSIPNGDTQWVSKEDYNRYLKKSNLK